VRLCSLVCNNGEIMKPLFFKQNRVRRIYTGGALFGEFFNDDSTDGYFPEEWICSTTKALNEGSTEEKEGISVLESGEYFDDYLEAHKQEILGDRDEIGILVKILDSSIRLPVQCHPDKEFSRNHFNSEHGKAESWVVLGTRENACIYFGFKEKISLEDFDNALKAGDNELLPLLNRIPVKIGDVFFIPAKAVHAIGAGCLILETQEPTDFTIQPERTCGDYVLSDNEMYLGLAPEIAMSCFDMNLVGNEAEKIARKTAKKIGNKESLITDADTNCFNVNRYVLNNESSENLIGCAIYVVTEGEGYLVGNEYSRPIKKGDYFFMPDCLCGLYHIKTGTNIQIVQCLNRE